MNLKLSARRIVAAHRNGVSADRIPIASPISWDPTRDIDAEKPGGWRADPGFLRVARLVQELCDPVPPYAPVARPRVFSSVSYQRFLEAPDEIEAKVAAAIRDSGKERFLLFPSATPHERHTPRLLANAERYLRTAAALGGR